MKTTTKEQQGEERKGCLYSGMTTTHLFKNSTTCAHHPSFNRKQLETMRVAEEQKRECSSGGNKKSACQT